MHVHVHVPIVYVCIYTNILYVGRFHSSTIQREQLLALFPAVLSITC